MAKGTAQSTDASVNRRASRRSFIGRFGVAGLALASGGVGAVHAQGRGSTRPSTTRVPAAEPGSGTGLSLDGAVNVVTVAPTSAGQSAAARLGQRKASRAPLTPSGKNQLLNAIASQAEGASALAALGITPKGVGRGGATLYGSSGALALVLASDPLAKAYAAGVTLTPAGCEYAPNIVVDEQPILYFTDCAAAGTCNSAKPPNPKSLILTGANITPKEPLLDLVISAAGTPNVSLPYIFELDMDDAAGSTRAGLNGTWLSWSTSSKGTYVALATMPGGKWQGFMQIHERLDLSPSYWGAFHWLRITAL